MPCGYIQCDVLGIYKGIGIHVLVNTAAVDDSGRLLDRWTTRAEIDAESHALRTYCEMSAVELLFAVAPTLPLRQFRTLDILSPISPYCRRKLN
jgi:hypothetical protein